MQALQKTFRWAFWFQYKGSQAHVERVRLSCFYTIRPTVGPKQIDGQQMRNYALATVRRTIRFPAIKDEQWVRDVIDPTIEMRMGDWVFYAGEVLASESHSKGRLLSGELECSTRNPARISIPVLISERAQLSVFCNDQQVWSVIARRQSCESEVSPRLRRYYEGKGTRQYFLAPIAIHF